MIGDSHDVLVGGVLGYQFWDYLAAEIRGYGGTTDDEVQVKYHYSALVRVICRQHRRSNLISYLGTVIQKPTTSATLSQTQILCMV